MDEVAGKRFEDSTLAKTAKFFIYAPPLFTQRKSKRPLPNVPFANAKRWKKAFTICGGCIYVEAMLTK